MNTNQLAIANAIYDAFDDIMRHGMRHGSSHGYKKSFKGTSDDATWARNILLRISEKIETDTSRWSFSFRVTDPSDELFDVEFNLCEHEDTLYDALEFLEEILEEDSEDS